MLKVLHTGDEHFGNKADKLAEVVTTTDFILERARIEQPDVAIVAGDLVDEHDGPIRIDSEAARAAIRFVTELGDICPIVIVRGTRSHDRETPYLFRHLRTTHPVHVSSMIEVVAMLPDNSFVPVSDETAHLLEVSKAVFTLLPSPDKSNLIAAHGCESILSSNMIAKDNVNDVLAFLGEVNKQVPGHVPRILAGHGMITGAVFSSGTIATGEDIEYTTSDLALTDTDLKLFGHVHKFQQFAGNIFYCGSPGRLNMGETETKGFLVHTLNGRSLEETRFIETPARRFILYDVPWNDDGIENILAQATACEKECSGADVRFRYSIPEECRHQINREEIANRFKAAGARLAKIDLTVIPKYRQRAAGISRLESLPAKLVKWAETTEIELPRRVLDIAATIEGMSVEELVEDALLAIGKARESQQLSEVLATAGIPDPPSSCDQTGAADRYQNTQMGLFGSHQQ